MSFQRSASALGFGWQDMMRLNRKAKTTSHKIKDIEGALIYWVGPGAMLNRKAAVDNKNGLVNYFKHCILGQEDIKAIGGIFKDLSLEWVNAKAKYGLDPRMGIATERMVQSIQAIDSGGGKWKVGIKKGTSAQGTKIGVDGYAQVFEWGSYKQQARPMFMHFFMKWLKEKVPELVRPFAKEFAAKYNDLKGEWEGVNVNTSDVERDLPVHLMGDGEFEIPDMRNEPASAYESKYEPEPEAYYESETDDEFGDTSEYDREEQNLLDNYRKFLARVEKEIHAATGKPVNPADLDDKNFWNSLLQQFDIDSKIWKKLVDLYSKLADMQESVRGR